jgi:hypothetical protein
VRFEVLAAIIVKMTALSNVTQRGFGEVFQTFGAIIASKLWKP